MIQSCTPPFGFIWMPIYSHSSMAYEANLRVFYLAGHLQGQFAEQTVTLRGFQELIRWLFFINLHSGLCVLVGFANRFAWMMRQLMRVIWLRQTYFTGLFIRAYRPSLCGAKGSSQAAPQLKQRMPAGNTSFNFILLVRIFGRVRPAAGYTETEMRI